MTFKKREAAADDNEEQQQPDVNHSVLQPYNPQTDAAHSFAASVSKDRGSTHESLIVS